MIDGKYPRFSLLHFGNLGFIQHYLIAGFFRAEVFFELEANSVLCLVDDDGVELLAVNCFHDDVAWVKPVTEDQKQDHAAKMEGGLGDVARWLFRFGHPEGSFDLCPLAFAKHCRHQQADDHCENYGANSPSNSNG